MGLTMATEPWLDQGMTDTDEDMFDFGPEKVTVTTTPDVHAATEALLVAVALWVDAEDSYTVQYGSTATDRLRWQYRQYKNALDESETF